MKRRPILFWPLAIAYTAGAIVWSFSACFTEQRFYRAIPVMADFLSVHRDLAARWPDIGRSPLVETVFTSSGMKSEEVAALNNDRQFRDWMGRLLTDEFAAAQFTAVHGGTSAWVFAAWLGGKSQAYRLALHLSTVPGLTYEGTRHGWPVWAGASSKSKTGEIFAFSLVEGMMVATYGDGTDPLHVVLDCIDGLHPSLGHHTDAHPPSGTADRGWFKIKKATRSFSEIQRANFELTTFTSNHLAGRLTIPRALPADALPITATAAKPFSATQTDLPTSVAILPPSLAAHWLDDGETGSIRNTSATLTGLADGPIFASLFGGDYRGRFLQARIPGVVLAAPSTNAAALQPATAAVLADINETTSLKLELASHPTPAATAWSVVSRASNTLYGMTQPGDQIGLITGTNWIGLVSCVGAFDKIANDAILRANRPLRLDVAAESAAKRNARAYAWLNLPETAPALRTATGTWIMKLKGKNTRSSQALRNQINTTMRWFNGLQPLGTIELFATPDGTNTLVEFSSTPAR